MDPLSIAATCLQVAETVYNVSSFVAKFINGANSVDDNLKDLLTELRDLHSQIDDIRACFENDAFVNGLQSFQQNNGGSISTNLFKHLQHCQYSAERLDGILKTFTQLGNDASFLRRGVTHWQMESKMEEIAKVRTQIQNSKTSLMLSLGVIQICKSIQSDERDPIQTDILHAKIDNIEKLLQKLGARIQASKKMVASVEDEETLMLDDMEATRLVSVKVKNVATSEMVRRASIAGTERNFISSMSIQGIPLSQERKREVERWIPNMQTPDELDELNTQKDKASSPDSASSPRSKKPILLPATPMPPPPESQKKQSQPRVSPQSLPKRESSGSVSSSSPPAKAATSISIEDFETSIAAIIAEAEARTTPGKPYAEEDFLEISRLLNLVGKPQWGERPRTYLVLRLIGEVRAMGSFIIEQMNDIHFPYTEATLPKSCLPGAGARNSFIQKQSLVFSQRPADLVLGGPHRHLGKTADIYFDNFETLGRGGYGVVDHVKSKLSLKHYARKRIQRSIAFGKKKDILKVFENEIHNLKRLDHHHLVKFVGSYTDSKYIGLIMEPVAETDLLQFLKGDSFRDEELSMLRGFFGCLSAAVVYLHNNKCRHKDLKPGNILINNGVVLITDFGIALDWTDLGQDTTTGKPEAYTNSYVAPEVAAAKPRNVAADIWSLGCVFMDILTILKGETLTAKKNFFDKTGSSSSSVWENQEALRGWLNHLEHKSEEDSDPVLWIRQMTTQDPVKRPSAEDILSDIQKTTDHNIYCAVCCNDNASSDKTSWCGSDSEEEHISLTRNTTVSNPMKSPPQSPPIPSNGKFERRKSSSSEDPLKGRPKLPRFPWQDQTTTAIPSEDKSKSFVLPSTKAVKEPVAAEESVKPSESSKVPIRNSSLKGSHLKKPDFGDFDTKSEATVEIEREPFRDSRDFFVDTEFQFSGHFPRNTTFDDTINGSEPEETFFHTHFATSSNPMRAVPVSFAAADFRKSSIAPLSKDNDPTKDDQDIIKSLFEGDGIGLEDFLLELRSRGDGKWKNTLLKAVNVTEKDKKGNQLLHIAASFSNDGLSRDVIEAILQRSPDVNALNIYGNSPLHYMAANSRTSLMKYMLKFGANSNLTNVRKQTALHIATQKGSQAVIKMLTQNGSPDFIDMADDHGKTALHYACETGKIGIVGALLDGKASLDVKDDEGNTPTALASASGDESFQMELESLLFDRSDLFSLAESMGDPFGTGSPSFDLGSPPMGLRSPPLGMGPPPTRPSPFDLGSPPIRPSPFDLGPPPTRSSPFDLGPSPTRPSPFDLGPSPTRPSPFDLGPSPFGLGPPPPPGMGRSPFQPGIRPPMVSKLDLSKPCKCEVCKLTAAIESLPENKELDLLKCPCFGHLKVLSAEMLSAWEPLDSALAFCKCAKCLQVRKSTDDVNRAMKARTTACDCWICKESRDYGFGQDPFNDPGAGLGLGLGFDSDLPPYRGNEYYDKFIDMEIANNGFQSSLLPNPTQILSEAGFKGRNSYRTNPVKAMVWAMNNIATIQNLDGIIQLLLQSGAPVDSLNKDKCTFLHIAARHGMLRAAHILIQNGAKVNAIRESMMALKAYWTPLKYAFWYDQKEMMRLLLRNGAEIDHQPDLHKRTLLQEAIFDYANRGSHISMLLAHGASLQIKDAGGMTAFHLAVITGNLPVARALLEAGADVNDAVKPGQKPLYFAIEYADAEMATFLVQNGADVSSVCGDYVCALMHAVKKGDAGVLAALLDNSVASADMNRKDALGRTVLHILADGTATNIIDLLDLLILNGADMAIEDNTGSRPLHVAAKAGSLLMVSGLLCHGADVMMHAQNHSGKTPLDLAMAKRHKEVVEILGGTLKKKGLFRRG